MDVDENRLLSMVRKLGALRLAHPALWADADLKILQQGYPFVHQRTGGGETVVVAINPSGKAVTVDCDGEILLANNCVVVGKAVTLTGESFVIYKK
jgi:maltose alpha-D-glucosyltransferase/alpha-amylase